MKRRNFLKGSLGTLYMMASPNMAFPDVKLSDKRLLVVLLRGGLDGLATIHPLVIKIYLRLEKMFWFKALMIWMDFLGFIQI